MKKIIFALLTLVFYSTCCNSQDIISLANNDSIVAKVMEVTTTEIKYKRADNPSGPTYTILKTEVFKIRYENGKSEIINSKMVALDVAFLKLSRENPLELTKKGNKVFIEIPGDIVSQKGAKYFIEALSKWGYWEIVENENEAHFIIRVDFKEKAMKAKSAYITFKTRKKKEFKKSKVVKGKSNLYTGYDAFNDASNTLVKKYLMKSLNKSLYSIFGNSKIRFLGYMKKEKKITPQVMEGYFILCYYVRKSDYL